MMTPVLVEMENGDWIPGRTNDLGNSDGLVYVRLDNGSGANFPASRVRVVEDKELPQGRMEHK